MNKFSCAGENPSCAQIENRASTRNALSLPGFLMLLPNILEPIFQFSQLSEIGNQKLQADIRNRAQYR